MWRWMMGMYGLPGWGGWGRGWGWGGNPYPFCRMFPWLPRGWRWMYPYGMMYPYTYPYYTFAYPPYVNPYLRWWW